MMSHSQIKGESGVIPRGFENYGDAIIFYILILNEKITSRSLVSPYRLMENPNIYLKQKEQKKMCML